MNTKDTPGCSDNPEHDDIRGISRSEMRETEDDIAAGEIRAQHSALCSHEFQLYCRISEIESRKEEILRLIPSFDERWIDQASLERKGYQVRNRVPGPFTPEEKSALPEMLALEEERAEKTVKRLSIQEQIKELRARALGRGLDLDVDSKPTKQDVQPNSAGVLKSPRLRLASVLAIRALNSRLAGKAPPRTENCALSSCQPCTEKEQSAIEGLVWDDESPLVKRIEADIELLSRERDPERPVQGVTLGCI
jgi:hypothetical protein